MACPPPSKPVITVSATQEASDAATAASAAVPPSARISTPAAVVAGCPAATPACIALFYRGVAPVGCRVMNAASELPLVHARGLVKRFGERVAVDGIDFDVHKGEAFGFLGPNGAGKTSTMRMVGCVSPLSGGSLSVLGLDPVQDGPEIRARLGVVPQQDTLDFELTVRENIVIYGRYFGLPRAHLRQRAEDRVEPLSGGMKRRLTIARSLVNDPEMLLLDEPTTGLDPQARHTVWDRLFRLKQRGVTLILTTHYMDEAEHLCDRLVVMDKAKIVAEGSPLALISRYSTREQVELRFGLDQQPEELASR